MRTKLMIGCLCLATLPALGCGPAEDLGPTRYFSAATQTQPGKVLVPEVEKCMEDLASCLATATDPEKCHDAFVACMPDLEVPEPPDCDAEYNNCKATGMPEKLCDEFKALCNGTLVPPPPDPALDACMQKIHDCIAKTKDIEACHAQHASCLPAPPAPLDCAAEHKTCLANGLPKEVCDSMKEVCETPANAPPPESPPAPPAQID
jgi:hypothetical protein